MVKIVGKSTSHHGSLKKEKDMQTLIRNGVLALAGSVGAGLLTLGTTSANAAGDDVAVYKRELDSVSWVADDDDDDDDTSRSRSRVSNDSTNSRKTGVTRDRDRSRGDLTRDWTRDGGDRTKDKSRNHTNDRSRNDTRRNW